MADVIEIPEKIGTYPAAAYEVVKAGKAFDQSSIIGRDYGEFAALPESEKYKPLPDHQRLDAEQMNHVREVAIRGEAQKIFEERLMEWGKPFRVEIKFDWIRHHTEFPTKKQIMAMTKELYLSNVPQHERDSLQKLDTDIATFRLDGRLLFQVKLPVNLVPPEYEPLENWKPLYDKQIKAAQAKAALANPKAA